MTRGMVFGNMMTGNVTSDEIQTTSLTDVKFGYNYEGNAAARHRNLAVTIGAGETATIQTFAVASAQNDVLQLLNNFTTATFINVLLNKDTIGFYQNGVGSAKVMCDTIKLANAARIAAAGTPANFTADKMVQILDSGGNIVYVPGRASTW
jgi:hypothetical protein